MKTLERCFGVSVAWFHERLLSKDYKILCTRSYDMAADICTKGFSSAESFWRLRRLINVYQRVEIDGGCWNPEPKMVDGSSVYDNEYFDPSQNNTQYQVLMAADDSMVDTRKPVKEKPKLRRKQSPKPSMSGKWSMKDPSGRGLLG